ncbi:MAG: T9SS type A sorting domain-containing protein [Flavobacteriales bacterium]
MKKLYVLASSVLILSAVMIFAPDAKSNQSGAVSNYSGVNSSLGTCAKSGCHSGGANTGPGSISITGNIPVAGYTGGQVYQLTVTVNSGGTNGGVFGFAVSGAKTGTNTIAGTFANTDNNAQIRSSGQYVTHTLAGINNGGNTASKSFVVNWTAPAAGTGAVRLFAAGNSGNNNGASTGDNIYTTTLDVPEEETQVSLDEVALQSIHVFPNPASDLVTVENFISSDWNLNVLDLTGKTLMSHNVTTEKFTLDVSELPAGMYLVEIGTNGKSVIKKIIVQ